MQQTRVSQEDRNMERASPDARSETIYAEERAPTIVTINSHLKVVVRQIAFLSLATVFLLSAACGEKSWPKMEAHRLGRPETLEWPAAGFRDRKPIEFKSREGHGCCDMGDTSLAFHPDRTIHILRERFVGTEFNVRYNILTDGKITVVPTDNKERADYLLSEDIHDFYLFRYGSSLYLVQESNVRPDLAVPGGTHWPLKYMPGTNAAD